MSDIFKDMQANVGCDYISNLPSYKRKVWHEMKRLPLTNYDIKQLEDFSKYVFGMSYQSLKDVMKQQKGREEPKTPEADASVDADTVNDATAFLETFFKLYPTATEKELAYYVLGNVIEPIGRDYLYSELVNPIFIKDGDNVKVKVAVKFIDNQTKATQVSQYELVLHKDSNWKIVG